MLVLVGCRKPPVPQDSFTITIDDYNRVSVDSVESPVLPADTVVSFVVQPDSYSDSILPADSLFLSADSLFTDSLVSDSLYADSLCADSMAADSTDTLAAEDTLAAPELPSSWRFMEVEIQGSLYRSLSSAEGVNPDILGAHCVRHLVWEMNPWSGFIAGDTVRILYDPQVSDRENTVMAIEYVPVSGSSNTGFSAYTWKRTGDNWPSIWLADGTELVKLLDRMPVRTFEEITSVYGEPRGNHSHAGIDYKAPEGTPVFSVTGGTVSRTNWNTRYNGSCVEIDFGGYSEMFLHLNTIEAGISPGAIVSPGDQIGTVGNTGISTAAHLHYQINDSQGYSIDPYLYFSSHRRSLPASDLEVFGAMVEMCREAMGSSR